MVLAGEDLSGTPCSNGRVRRPLRWDERGQGAAEWGEGTREERRSLPGPVLAAGDLTTHSLNHIKSPFTARRALYTRNHGRKLLKSAWVQEWEGVLPSQFGTPCKRKSRGWAFPGRIRGKASRSKAQGRGWQSLSRKGQTGKTLCATQCLAARTSIKVWTTQKQTSLNHEDPFQPEGKTGSRNYRWSIHFSEAASAAPLAGRRTSTPHSDLPLQRGL